MARKRWPEGVNREFADGTVCSEPPARQSEAGECDINRIVSQYAKSGVLPVGFAQGIFEDVSAIGDYRAALERVRIAEAEFMRLPPQVRLKFENDPLRFVEFAVNPENEQAMVELGLLERRPAVAEPVAEAVKSA